MAPTKPWCHEWHPACVLPLTAGKRTCPCHPEASPSLPGELDRGEEGFDRGSLLGHGVGGADDADEPEFFADPGHGDELAHLGADEFVEFAVVAAEFHGRRGELCDFVGVGGG